MKLSLVFSMVVQGNVPRGLLLTQAVGDAYGAGFEFASESFVRANNTVTRYLQHPKHTILPGCYTDDTQMSIALAEVIASNREWTAREIAESFVHCFHRDPREGYAGRFYEFLKSVRTGAEFCDKIRPDSDKNGAAMRAPVIGLYPYLEDVVERSSVQARITHNTREGVDSAVAASLCAHYFAYGLGELSELRGFLNVHVPGYRWDKDWEGDVPAKGIPTVRAAVTAVVNSSSLRDVLKRSVDFCGDVDSVAAIALACASLSASHNKALPEWATRGLEDGAYGQTYLRAMDLRLKEIFQIP